MPVSQVQVAAAASAVTGAPLHVATPMAPYISHYQQAHPQTFPGPYAQMVRIYPTLFKICIFCFVFRIRCFSERLL